MSPTPRPSETTTALTLTLALTLSLAAASILPAAAAPPAAPPFDAPPRPYLAEFDRVYVPEKNQVLKRVPPPFIPERIQYYRAEQPDQAKAIPAGPDFMSFEYTEKTGLRQQAMGFGYKRLPLRHVLESALKLKSYDFEGPANLLDLDLAGDWIVRPDAPVADQLAALATLVKEAHGRTVRFVKQDLPREVIVASGAYHFTPLHGTYDDQRVHLFSGEQDPTEGAGGGSGNLAEFLKALGDRTGSRVVDETAGDRPDMIHWGHHYSSQLSNLPPGPDRDARLKALLDVLSAQTGLTFQPARRDVPVWVLIEVRPQA